MYSNVKSVSRKLIALLLCAVMVFSIMPLSVFADPLKPETTEDGNFDFVVSGYDGSQEIETVTDATLTIKDGSSTVYEKDAEGVAFSVPYADVESYLDAAYTWTVSAPTFEDYSLDQSSISVATPIEVHLQAVFYTVSVSAQNTETVQFEAGFDNRVREGGSFAFTIQTSAKDATKQHFSQFYYKMGDLYYNVKPNEEVTTVAATADIEIVAEVTEGELNMDFDVADGSWTNSDSIAVTCADNQFKLYYSATEAYGDDAQEVPIALSEEGENTFFVWGEKTEGDKVIKSDPVEYTVKYDDTAPEVDSYSFTTDSGEYTPGEWTKEDVTFTANVSDAYSGVATVAIYDSNDQFFANMTEEDGSYTYTFNVADGSSLNGSYYLQVTDNAGLTYTTTPVDIMIDKASPVFDSIYFSENHWTKENVNLAATVSDADSGAVKVTLYNSKDETVDEKELTDSIYQYTFEVETDTYLDDTFYLVLEDAVGNTTTSPAAPVKIDKVKPEVEIKSVSQKNTDGITKVLNTLTFGIFFKPEIEVEVAASDANSGLQEYKLVIDRNGTTKEYLADPADATTVFTIGDDVANDFGVDFTSEEFLFNIKAVATDNVGNTKEDLPSQFDFAEKTSPNLFMREQIVPESDLQVNGEAYDTATQNWYADNAEIKIHAQDANSGIYKVELIDKNDGDKVYTYAYGAAETAVETKEEYITLNTADLKFDTATGTYNFTVQVTDNCGNLSEEKTYTIKKDINAPQITNIEYTEAAAQDSALSYEPAVIKNEKGNYGYFFKEATKVTLFVSDSLLGEASSGIQDVVVNLVDFEGNASVPTLDKSDLSKVSFTVEAGFKGYIYAYAVDAVGNSTYKDGLAADLSYQADADNDNAKRNELNASEGKKNWISSTYADKLQRTEDPTYDGYVSAFGLIAETADEHSQNVQEIPAADTGWTIVAQDAANHVALYRKNAAFNHDQTNPDTLFYNETVEMKVVVTDRFNGIRSAAVNFTNCGGHDAAFSIEDAALENRAVGNTVDEWKIEAVDENLITQISKEFTIAKTEEYTYIAIDANMQDMSGNTSAISTDHFSVDSTAPRFDIQVNGADYAPEDHFEWYADNVEVTINTNDNEKTNQSGLYTIEVIDLNDGEAVAKEYKYGKDAIATLTQEASDSFNTADLTFDTASSLYHFRIKVTDNAGNYTEKTYIIKKDINAPQITDIEFTYAGIDKNLEGEEYTPKIIRNEGNDYGFFIEKATTVTLKVSDALLGEDRSGIQDVVVKVLDLSGNNIDIQNLDKSNLNAVTFDIAAGFKGYIYAYAVDAVGNSTYKEGLASDLSYQGKEGTSYTGTDDSHYARNAYNDTATKESAADHAINWISSTYAEKLRRTESPNYAGYVSAYGVIAETKDQHETNVQEIPAAAEGWTIVAQDAANHVALYRKNAAFDHDKTDPDTLFYNDTVEMKVVVTDRFNGIRTAAVNFTNCSGHDAAFSIDDAALANRAVGNTVDEWKIEAVDENLITQISKEFTIAKTEEYTYIDFAADMQDMSGNTSAIADKFSVDSTAPRFDIQVNGADYAPEDHFEWYADNVEVTINTNDTEKANQSGLYTVQVYDLNNSEALVKEYKYGKDSIATLTQEASDSFNTSDLTFDTASSLYHFRINLTDNAGNSIVKSYIIKKDINAPQITDINFAYIGIDKNIEGAEYTPEIIRNEGNEYGFFIGKATTVTLNVSDSLLHEDCSGIQDVIVKVLDLSGNNIDIQNLDKSNLNAVTFDIAAGFKGYIYAYAVDAVGNSTYKDGLASDLSYQGKPGTSYVDTDNDHFARNYYNNLATQTGAADHAINWISSTYAEKLRRTENPDYAGYVSAYGVITETQDQHDTNVQEIPAAEEGWTIVAQDEANHVALYRKNAPFNHARTNPDTLFYNDTVEIKVVVTDRFNGIRTAEVKFTNCDGHDAAFSIDNAAIAERADGSVVDGWTIDDIDENLVTQISKEFTIEKTEEYTYIGFNANMQDMSYNASAISDEFSVDSTAPRFDIQVNGSDYAPEDSVWYPDNVEITINTNDTEKENQSGIYNVAVYDDNNDGKLVKEYKYGKDSIATLVQETGDSFNTSDLTFDPKDSDYNFTIVVFDNCGNKITKVYNIKKDLNAPQVTDISFTPAETAIDTRLNGGEEYLPEIIENENNYYGFFFQKATTVTLNISDSLLGEASSGIKEVYVKVVDMLAKGSDNIGQEIEPQNFNHSDDWSVVTFDIPAGLKCYIYAYAVDAVDNSTYDGGLADSLSYQGKEYEDTDISESVTAEQAHANRNEYNNKNGAVNWISADYAKRLRMTEEPNYAGYVSAYGLIAEGISDHMNFDEKMPDEYEGLVSKGTSSDQHIMIYREERDYENNYGDLYSRGKQAVQVRIVVTDTMNGIRNAELFFGSAVDVSARQLNENYSAHFDIYEDKVPVDVAVGTKIGGWVVTQVDKTANSSTNLITQVAKDIYITEETNNINFGVTMTDMGMNTSAAKDVFSIDRTAPKLTVIDKNDRTANNGTGDTMFYKYTRTIKVAVQDANFYPNLLNNEALKHWGSTAEYNLQHKGYDDKNFSPYKQVHEYNHMWSLEGSKVHDSVDSVHYFTFTASDEGEYWLKLFEVVDAAQKKSTYTPENTTVNCVRHFYIDLTPPVIEMIKSGSYNYIQNLESIDYFQNPSLDYTITLNDGGAVNGLTTQNYSTYFNASGEGAFNYTVDSAPESGVINAIASQSRVSTQTYSEKSSDYYSYEFAMSYSDRAGNPASYTFNTGGSNDFASQSTFKPVKVCPDSTTPKITIPDGITVADASKVKSYQPKVSAYDLNLSNFYLTLSVDSWYNKDAKALTVEEKNLGSVENKASTLEGELLNTVIKADQSGKYDSTLSYKLAADDRANNKSEENSGGVFASVDGRGSFFMVNNMKGEKSTFLKYYHDKCVQSIKHDLVFTEYSVLSDKSTLHIIDAKTKKEIALTQDVVNANKNVNPVKKDPAKDSQNESYSVYATTWTIPASFFNQKVESGKLIDCNYRIYVQDASGQKSYVVGTEVDNIKSEKKITDNLKNRLAKAESLHFALDNETPIIEVIGEDAQAIMAALKDGTTAIFKPDDQSKELKIALSDESITWLNYAKKYANKDNEVLLNDKTLNALLPDLTDIHLGDDKPLQPSDIDIEAGRVIYTYILDDNTDNYQAGLRAQDEAGNKTNELTNDEEVIDSTNLKLLVSSNFFVRLWSNIVNFVQKHTAIVIIGGAVILAGIAAIFIIPVIRKRNEDPDEVDDE